MGTIRQRGGKYQAIVKRQDFGTASQTFIQHKDALAWIRAKEAAMDRGEALHTEQAIIFTLASGLARYRDTITPGKKGAKSEFYRIAKWLADPLAERSIDTLSAVDFATWRDKRLAQVTGATVNRELSLVSAVLDVARLEWGFISMRNALRDIRKPPQGKPRSRRISEPELAAIVEATESKELGWFLRLAIATAMRAGELAPLKWNDLDTVKRVAVLADTKNGERRIVPLSGEALRVLAEMPRRIDGRLFGNKTHTFSVSMRNAVIRARKHYEAACAKDGRKPDPEFLIDVRLHDARHEAVSSLFERGLDATEVASISGHKTMQMLARYTHHKAERLALKLA
jgi:integrase